MINESLSNLLSVKAIFLKIGVFIFNGLLKYGNIFIICLNTSGNLFTKSIAEYTP